MMGKTGQEKDHEWTDLNIGPGMKAISHKKKLTEAFEGIWPWMQSKMLLYQPLGTVKEPI